MSKYKNLIALDTSKIVKNNILLTYNLKINLMDIWINTELGNIDADIDIPNVKNTILNTIKNYNEVLNKLTLDDVDIDLNEKTIIVKKECKYYKGQLNFTGNYRFSLKRYNANLGNIKNVTEQNVLDIFNHLNGLDLTLEKDISFNLYDKTMFGLETSDKIHGNIEYISNYGTDLSTCIALIETNLVSQTIILTLFNLLNGLSLTMKDVTIRKNNGSWYIIANPKSLLAYGSIKLMISLDID